ncbi:hypothetical protein Tco_0752079 [Tanacetum coccineum]|uniref:Uncharacterized protein n=1 Tax=Tanacetum coccineum TaxID=301880 RepID=A0ABQ4Z9I1_9ASTR
MVIRLLVLGWGPVHSRNNVNNQNQYVPQAVLLRTRKVNITPVRPQPVPIGKPKVPIPVPTGRQNWPIPVPTGRVDSPSVTSGRSTLIEGKDLDSQGDGLIGKNTICADVHVFHVIESSRLVVAVKFIFQSSRYVVILVGVVDPTGWYVVTAGKVIIIVVMSRLILVPSG